MWCQGPEDINRPYLPWLGPWGCPYLAHSPGPHFIPLGPSVPAPVMPQQCWASAPHSPALPGRGPHWSGLRPTDWHTAWPRMGLITTDPPGDGWPRFRPWPAAWLPGFRIVDLPCHHTLAWWPRPWAEAGCHLWVCPAPSLAVVGQALLSGFPAPLAVVIALSSWLSSPQEAGSPCCSLMWKVKKSVISCPRHEKASKALKLSLVCFCVAARDNQPGGKRDRRCQSERGWARNAILPLCLLGFGNTLNCMYQMEINTDVSNLLLYRTFYTDAFNTFYSAFSIPIF